MKKVIYKGKVIRMDNDVDIPRLLGRTVEFFLKEYVYEILFHLDEDEKISPMRLGEKVGISNHLAYGVLQALQSDGLASPLSKEEGGGWMLNEFQQEEIFDD